MFGFFAGEDVSIVRVAARFAGPWCTRALKWGDVGMCTEVWDPAGEPMDLKDGVEGLACFERF